MAFVTLRLFCEANILHQGAVADGSFTRMGGTLGVYHTVLQARHQHAPFFRVANWSRGFGDVWQLREPRDVVQQAARLCIGGIAVGVPIFLLNVPPQLPTLPLLKDLRLDLLKIKPEVKMSTWQGNSDGINASQSRRLTSLLTKQYKMATRRPWGDKQYCISPC